MDTLKNQIIKLKSIILLGLLFPQIIYAQPTDFKDLVDSYLLPLFRLFITAIISIAVIIFVWNGVKMIATADNAQKRAEYKQSVIWSIIVVFIMVSFWGIVTIFQNTFGVGL